MVNTKILLTRFIDKGFIISFKFSKFERTLLFSKYLCFYFSNLEPMFNHLAKKMINKSLINRKIYRE